MGSDEETLKQIDGIGDIVANNIYNFFRKEKNREIKEQIETRKNASNKYHLHSVQKKLFYQCRA